MNFSNIINYFIDNQHLEDISQHTAIAITYLDQRKTFLKIEVGILNNSILIKSHECRIFGEKEIILNPRQNVYVLLHESIKSIKNDFSREYGEDLSFTIYPPTTYGLEESTMEYFIYRHLKAYLPCPSQIQRGSIEEQEFRATAIRELYIANKQIDLFHE
ncbi:hypothetical protein HLH17_02195 [Acinetobacter sp. ANC 5380]|uniref:Uncharacterized protein n=1 Tax=Acinetobacter terrae TaxID=2731247 RepID=A0A7Y2RD63_9GAMM|nr:hypothetical protein [Acinetobacter terrae]NNH76512.1 hypothetical protein [Acinetobacter terrae]